MKYVYWKFDWQILAHSVDVDFNDRRVQAHLKALVQGYGSTTEGIVNDFVLNTTDVLKHYSSVQAAWSRLDEGQRQYVLAFRNMMAKPVLGDPGDFPHLFYAETICNRYMDLLTDHEEQYGEDEVSIDTKVTLAEKAESIVNEQLSSDVSEPVWSVKQEAA